MPLTTLALFRAEFLGLVENDDPREEYRANPTLLAALSPTEREQAARELLAAVRTGRFDSRAVCGLGYLRCAAALPLLHRLLRRADYVPAVLIAIARIEPASLDPSTVVALLTPGLRWWPPLALFSSLLDRTFPLTGTLTGLRSAFTWADLSPAVLSRIFALLAHPNFFIRYHALYTLRTLYDMPIARQGLHDDLSQDALFPLLRTNRTPASYRRAQQLFLTQLPAADRAPLLLAPGLSFLLYSGAAGGS